MRVCAHALAVLCCGITSLVLARLRSRGLKTRNDTFGCWWPPHGKKALMGQRSAAHLCLVVAAAARSCWLVVEVAVGRKYSRQVDGYSWMRRAAARGAAAQPAEGAGARACERTSHQQTTRRAQIKPRRIVAPKTTHQRTTQRASVKSSRHRFS